MTAGRCMLRLAALIGLSMGSMPLVAQTPAEGMERLAGMWRLGSYEHHFADGASRQDPRTAAYLVYSATGHMCYVSMDPQRPRWRSATGPTAEEALTGIMGLGAYCGTVEVNVEEGFVLHHVEIERSPNNVGITRKRFFEFRGPNELFLRVDPAELAPPLVGMSLVWRRVLS